MVFVTTFLEILREYNPDQEIIYPSNYYSDMRKKLIVAFECLGLYDLEIFKSNNGKDYDFLETNKEYIFYLLDIETSPLFKNIKGKKMTMEDYVSLVPEVENLFVFIKPYVKDDEEYNRIVSEISLNTRYPIIKRFAETQSVYYSLHNYYESIVKGNGLVTTFSDWLFLTENDQVKLFDELIVATKKWIKLVEKFCEFRSDEVMEAINNATIDDVCTYALVDEEISEEYCEKYKELFPLHTKKARSIRSAMLKVKAQRDESNKLKLDLAKKYCDAHNIDFQTYLTEKEKAETPDFEPVSTEEAFKTISNEIK